MKLLIAAILLCCAADCRPQRANEQVQAEASPPTTIKVQGGIYVVHFRVAGPYCDTFYWLDAKARVCLAMTCSHIGGVVPQEQCDRMISTYAMDR